MLSDGEDRRTFGYNDLKALKRAYPNGTLSGETKLRKFSDGTSNRCHWYEVKPELVVWAGSRTNAETGYAAAQACGNTSYGRKLSDVRRIYSDDFVRVPE